MNQPLHALHSRTDGVVAFTLAGARLVDFPGTYRDDLKPLIEYIIKYTSLLRLLKVGSNFAFCMISVQPSILEQLDHLPTQT